jgi:hypothetical protein
MINFKPLHFVRPDVWAVTTTQALVWMTDPKPAQELINYEPWLCKKEPNTLGPCNLPNKCPLRFKAPDANVTSTR